MRCRRRSRVRGFCSASSRSSFEESRRWPKGLRSYRSVSSQTGLWGRAAQHDLHAPRSTERGPAQLLEEVRAVSSASDVKEVHMPKKYTAQCACGAVKFEFNTDPSFVAVCHCLDCKKASGGEAATFFGVPEDDFTLISGEPKAFHYIAQSGKGLDRNFCPNCGARVFTTNLESFPGMIFVTLGSMDNPKGIEPVLEMFTKRRLEWAKPLDLPQFENMPS